MIVNQQNLTNLYMALSTAFNSAWEETQPWYEQVAMVVPTNTKTVDYKYLANFPLVQEWIGERQIQSLVAYNFHLSTKDYEATIEIERNDIEDDQLGMYNPIVAELGRTIKQHPDSLIASLMEAGFTTEIYDGCMFFDGNHPVGATTVSNLGSGSSTAWYLFDTSRKVKPFIFQLRRKAELVRQDRPDDDHAFLRKKFRYGVDYRAAAGYGLWQMAYGSKATLNATNYAAARTAMMAFKGPDGKPLGIQPNLLVVPPALEATAREILHADFILGDATVGGSKTNIWKGSADLLVVPYLS